MKTYFVCTWNTYQSFQKIMQKMCQKLTCMFSNWLKIIPFTLYADTDSCIKLFCYSSDLVVQFKSNFDLSILIFFIKIILFLFSGKFFSRSCLFSLLWVLTNFFYIRGLVALGCTEMISLFATNVSFVYMLSWVVLHEQFVGIRVSISILN